MRDKYEMVVIPLDDVKNCSVKKIYSAIIPGALKRRNIEDYLERIDLYFEFVNGRASEAVPFYERAQDHIYDLLKLEQKARDWQSILQKIVVNRLETA